MSELPTGTVTLLFTDIEGSTRLLQQVGERYADLLAECPHLTVLVTSREALHLRAEHQFVVTPLPLPALPPGEACQWLDPAALAENPALQYFLHRIQAARPDFQLTPDTAVTLARICQHLEGIPLALELAAPRLKLLSPQALLARLEGRLQVLTGGARDLPERQRTMRTTLAWSYELLSPAEQALFRRLAVFVTSWRLVGAEQVCQADAVRPAHLFNMHLPSSR